MSPPDAPPGDRPAQGDRPQTLKEFLDALPPEALIERLKLALDGSGLGIWDWDLRDDSVQFDQRWCEMLGLDHATTPMALSTWSERAHPDDLAQCFADIKAHLEGRTPVYENVHRMRHADGRWRYILDRGRISARDAHGKPIRFTGTHTDVTAMEEARRVLAEQDAALTALVAALPNGVAMLDRELRYLTASARWCEALGLTREALLGQPFGPTEALPLDRWRPALERALRGEPSHAEEDLVSKAGDAPRYWRWDARPWHKADGSVGGVLASKEDVSERVLQRELAERQRTARLSTLALFSGGLAHELNTPLQVMLNEAEYGQALLRDAELDREGLAEAFGAIEETARRAAAITHALRTLSRDARNDPAHPIALAGLLADAMALTRGRFSSVGIALTLEDRAGGLHVLGRPSELLHVLINLLNNAADAVHDVPDAWIRLEVSTSEDTALVRCVDSGPGVAPAHRAQLMSPFFTTKPHGTGIGLSLSRTLVERDGGFLRYVPEAARTTFELGLPLFHPDRGSHADPVG